MLMQISGLYLNVPVLIIYWSGFSTYTREVFLFYDVDYSKMLRARSDRSACLISRAHLSSRIDACQSQAGRHVCSQAPISLDLSLNWIAPEHILHYVTSISISDPFN